MPNDYSNYVMAVYIIGGFVSIGLLLFVVQKYFAAKAPHNQK